MPSPSAMSEAPPLPEGAERRWHFHRWNTPLAWELILRITPRLPGFLLTPLHHATSLVFFAATRRERAAARRNLERVTGRRGLGNLRLAYRLFYNFSRFMVAYTELRHLDPEALRPRLRGAEEAEEAIRRVLAEERGAIIATLHLGHWDLGLRLLSDLRIPIHVVMLSEDPAEVTRYADEARRIPGLRVHRAGSTPLLGVELILALKRGELVAVQADRPAGENVLAIPFFGAPTLLPTGPVRLAIASGAPILPVFVLLDGKRRYRVLALEPIRLPPSASPPDAPTLRSGMERLMGAMEPVIRDHPDQWFNFYDVWPAGGGAGGGSGV